MASCIGKSIRKYNLYCQATESQLQEYLAEKYELFLARSEEDEYPVKLAVRAVGLQQITEDEEDIGISSDVKVWILNEFIQVTHFKLSGLIIV